jgi:enterochelin esterase-like enzyme
MNLLRDGTAVLCRPGTVPAWVSFVHWVPMMKPLRVLASPLLLFGSLSLTTSMTAQPSTPSKPPVATPQSQIHQAQTSQAQKTEPQKTDSQTAVPQTAVPQRTAPHDPAVAADRSVTFTFPNIGAGSVDLALEGTAAAQPMTKTADGSWTLTTGPLVAEDYGYSFKVDGVRMLDPYNVHVRPNLLSPSSVVHVPGSSPMPWEVADVPHGVLHHHFYHSPLLTEQSDFYVYTPPNFDPNKKYPVLYLLHGYSDDVSGWTAVGNANVILDNLITAGTAKPMIVVMPLGYGTMDIIRATWSAWDDHALVDRNFGQFTQILLTEVKPQVEKLYPISSDRKDHAIAGLSMGGGESLLIGLNHLDEFAYVGAFSSAVARVNFEQSFPQLNAQLNKQLKLLWIACGREDHLFAGNQSFIDWLKQRGVQVTNIQTPGMHTWMVWRDNLIHFAPLLFQK